VICGVCSGLEAVSRRSCLGQGNKSRRGWRLWKMRLTHSSTKCIASCTAWPRNCKTTADGKPGDLLLHEQANQQVETLHIVTVELTDGGQRLLICGQVLPLPNRRHEHPPPELVVTAILALPVVVNCKIITVSPLNPTSKPPNLQQ
jgi:hypothetical protein